MEHGGGGFEQHGMKLRRREHQRQPKGVVKHLGKLQQARKAGEGAVTRTGQADS